MSKAETDNKTQEIASKINDLINSGKGNFIAHMNQEYDNLIQPYMIMLKKSFEEINRLAKENNDLKSKPTKNRAERRRQTKLENKNKKKSKKHTT